MPATPDRKQIHVYVTNDTHTWWHQLAYDHNTTVSGLIEAIAQRNVGVTHSVAQAARQIDDQRRNRKHRYPKK